MKVIPLVVRLAIWELLPVSVLYTYSLQKLWSKVYETSKLLVPVVVSHYVHALVYTHTQVNTQSKTRDQGAFPLDAASRMGLEKRIAIRC